MGNYTIPTILIGLIVMSMVITGTTIFMSDVTTTYNVDGVQDYSSIAKMEELQDDVNDMSGTLQNTSADPTVTDYAKGATRGTWSSVWLAFNSINIMQTMVDESIKELPVSIDDQTAAEDRPSGWFTPGIIAILTLIIIGAVWTMVTKTGN